MAELLELAVGTMTDEKIMSAACERNEAAARRIPSQSRFAG